MPARVVQRCYVVSAHAVGLDDFDVLGGDGEAGAAERGPGRARREHVVAVAAAEEGRVLAPHPVEQDALRTVRDLLLDAVERDGPRLAVGSELETEFVVAVRSVDLEHARIDYSPVAATGGSKLPKSGMAYSSPNCMNRSGPNGTGVKSIGGHAEIDVHHDPIEHAGAVGDEDVPLAPFAGRYARSIGDPEAEVVVTVLIDVGDDRLLSHADEAVVEGHVDRAVPAEAPPARSMKNVSSCQVPRSSKPSPSKSPTNGTPCKSLTSSEARVEREVMVRVEVPDRAARRSGRVEADFVAVDGVAVEIARHRQTVQLQRIRSTLMFGTPSLSVSTSQRKPPGNPAVRGQLVESVRGSPGSRHEVADEQVVAREAEVVDDVAIRVVEIIGIEERVAVRVDPDASGRVGGHFRSAVDGEPSDEILAGYAVTAGETGCLLRFLNVALAVRAR